MLTTTGWRISTSAIAIPPLANIALTAVTRSQVIHPLRHSLHAHPRLQRLHLRISTSSPGSPSGNSAVGSSNNNGGSGGLSVKDQIIIGVILPSISVIVAIIFGIRAWNNKK
jgi:hypothetical protein